MATPPELDDFPAAGILWRRWNAATETELAERNRPILLFVADADPFVAPFLRAILRALPADDRLRGLLHAEFPALYVDTGSLPEPLKRLGAGSRYHIAVLSPQGLTPLVVFDPVRGKPAELAAEIATVLERLLPIRQ